MRIALIGDYCEDVAAHRAIALALQHEAANRSVSITPKWLATAALTDPDVLLDYDGGWVVPASPYASFDNAIAAIRTLRQNDIPFLGTCGG